MARASTYTMLPLDRWAAVLGVQPMHFNQVVTAAIPNTVCGTPWKQWAWMEAQAPGREDVAQAIAAAEKMICREAGYSLIPQWQADERMPTVQPAYPEMFNVTGRDLRGQRQTVQLRWGHYVSGGIEQKVLIEAGATVTYTDADGDGYPETATVTVNTTVTDQCEIGVYFPGEAGATSWEVRPLRSVSIGAGVATIVMWRQQLPLPELWDALAPTAIDGDDDNNFLETVDVYRHYNDPQQQVQFLWSEPGCFCGSGDCVTCGAATQYGCLLGRNYRIGTVQYQPALWNAVTGSFDAAAYAVWRQPDSLRLWYYAGYQDTALDCPTLQMSPEWERAVAYLSLTLLNSGMCGCNNVEALTRWWRDEQTLNISTPAQSTSYQVGQRVLDNPFGATRGALFAWDRVNQDGNRLGRAMRL